MRTVLAVLSFMIIALPGVAKMDPSINQNTIIDSAITVLVLPPYDKIANAGISPDIQMMLEKALLGKGSLSVIPFPLKKLMGIPYQMVYDKKYCKPVVDRIDCEIIIMTQLMTETENKPGIWPWSYRVRIYNVTTNAQIDSIIGEDLKAEELMNDIDAKIDILLKDIESTFNKK